MEWCPLYKSLCFGFQILVSPGYGRNEYPGGLECLYIMKAPQVTKNFLHQTFYTYKPVILFDLNLLTTVLLRPYVLVFCIRNYFCRIRLHPFKSFRVLKQRRIRTGFGCTSMLVYHTIPAGSVLF
jgi:hypothetical protein